MALFGHELAEFSTYPRSIGATTRCLLGDFDWSAMEEVGRPLAGAWFWCFQIFVVNVMFNMLIAILIDSYAVVKTSTVNAETLWSQSNEIWRRYRGRVQGTRLSLFHIFKVLHGDHDIVTSARHKKTSMYDEVTAEDLCKEVKGLRMDQALDILTETAAMIKKDQHEEVTPEQQMEKLSSVESCAKAIFKGLQIIIDTSNSSSSTRRQSQQSALSMDTLSPVSELEERLTMRLESMEERVRMSIRMMEERQNEKHAALENLLRKEFAALQMRNGVRRDDTALEEKNIILQEVDAPPSDAPSSLCRQTLPLEFTSKCNMKR
eukprot:gnl/MRDRNA2_/MRDRNA2_149963_c0_seq1.p1 gnl/MRDRNA2_/MRDRNA2_149963_c0~~gnl/MRDRNA2_/MRDRNA2_149963_c0_seq1.p1  ORF type:complete len:364 (+),score=62.09 gnl/MRDRNA2_/MRDRNA2_149963_c0_seq1:134-1093(+)